MPIKNYKEINISKFVRNEMKEVLKGLLEISHSYEILLAKRKYDSESVSRNI